MSEVFAPIVEYHTIPEGNHIAIVKDVRLLQSSISNNHQVCITFELTELEMCEKHNPQISVSYNWRITPASSLYIRFLKPLRGRSILQFADKSRGINLDQFVGIECGISITHLCPENLEDPFPEVETVIEEIKHSHCC